MNQPRRPSNVDRAISSSAVNTRRKARARVVQAERRAKPWLREDATRILR